MEQILAFMLIGICLFLALAWSVYRIFNYFDEKEKRKLATLESNKSKKEWDEKIKDFNEKFLIAYKEEIKVCEKQGVKPPIFKDEDGCFVWLNREKRKRYAKMLKKRKV